MNNETWKPITGYEGLYEVSDYGRIRSLKRNTTNGVILKLCKDAHGYLKCSLTKDGLQRTVRVHRIVGLTFVENPHDLPILNHKDEDKTNNTVSNLEWCDSKYNLNYGSCNEKMALAKGRPFICLETDKVYLNQGDCAKEIGISRGSISQILCGRRESCKGFHFKHID